MKAAGYAGEVSQLKAFLVPLKKVTPEPVARFRTEPGVQMQADFTHVRRGKDPLIAFVATLGYGRATFARFTTSEDAATLCACPKEALHTFGGVPQQVLFDNPKTVVHEDILLQKLRWFRSGLTSTTCSTACWQLRPGATCHCGPPDPQRSIARTTIVTGDGSRSVPGRRLACRRSIS